MYVFGKTIQPAKVNAIQAENSKLPKIYLFILQNKVNNPEAFYGTQYHHVPPIFYVV
jgi:hypothetical protein